MKPIFSFILCVMLFSPCFSTHSDFIHLRDNSVITGQIISAQQDGYIYDEGRGHSPISRAQIARILFDPPQRAAKFLSFDNNADDATVSVKILPTLAFGQQLLQEATFATQSIFVAQYNISGAKSDPIRLFYETLKQKAREGLRVVVLVEYGVGTEAGVKFDSFAFGQELEAAGIIMRYSMEKKIQHKKLFVADEETVILGSANLTLSGVRENYEMNVLIKDENFAQQVLNDFNDLYLKSLSTSDIRLKELAR